MGLKKKWKENSSERLIQYLKEVRQIMESYFKVNQKIDMSHFDQKNDLAYLLALIVNCEFISDDDKEISSFGADDIVPLKLEIEDNRLLKYWGKINWLAIPNEHQCHRSFQDPFYGEFILNNKELVITKMMFGDYDKTDLDAFYWIDNEINWMYELEK